MSWSFEGVVKNSQDGKTFIQSKVTPFNLPQDVADLMMNRLDSLVQSPGSLIFIKSWGHGDNNRFQIEKIEMYVIAPLQYAQPAPVTTVEPVEDAVSHQTASETKQPGSDPADGQVVTASEAKPVLNSDEVKGNPAHAPGVPTVL